MTYTELYALTKQAAVSKQHIKRRLKLKKRTAKPVQKAVFTSPKATPPKATIVPPVASNEPMLPALRQRGDIALPSQLSAVGADERKNNTLKKLMWWLLGGTGVAAGAGAGTAYALSGDDLEDTKSAE